MLNLERAKLYLNLLRHREGRGSVATLPSIARGSMHAAEWKNLPFREWRLTGTNEAFSSAPSNPLGAYFDSIAEGRGVWKWMHYFDIYHRHLQKFVGKEVHVVEVGVYSGGSLGMWKTYFGHGCTIYGIDVKEACLAYQEERVRIFIGDQADRRFWGRFKTQVPDVDILIDDGGHLPEQQIATLEEMLPHIRAGGVYLCEDIHGVHNRFAAYVRGLADALNANAQRPGIELAVTPSPFQQSISSVHLYPFLAVIEKAYGRVERFVAPKHGTEWQPFL
jgi:hypothetical protein